MPFGRRAGGGRRKAPREPVQVQAIVATVTWSTPLVLLDISKTGARLRGSDLPRLLEEVMVGAGRVRAFGTVVWREGDECGVAFDNPVDGLCVYDLRRETTFVSVTARSLEEKLAAEDWLSGMAR